MRFLLPLWCVLLLANLQIIQAQNTNVEDLPIADEVTLTQSVSTPKPIASKPPSVAKTVRQSATKATPAFTAKPTVAAKFTFKKRTPIATGPAVAAPIEPALANVEDQPIEDIPSGENPVASASNTTTHPTDTTPGASAKMPTVPSAMNHEPPPRPNRPAETALPETDSEEYQEEGNFLWASFQQEFMQRAL